MSKVTSPPYPMYLDRETWDSESVLRAVRQASSQRGDLAWLKDAADFLEKEVARASMNKEQQQLIEVWATDYRFRTRRAETVIKLIRRAWLVEGPAPRLHKLAQRWVAKNWPALAKAIMLAVNYDPLQR